MQIVTHNGVFHADEVTAIAILQGAYPGAEITRTRNAELLEKAKNDGDVIVIDVGAEYQPELNNFDHHQAGFSECHDDDVPYSSAGLVWKAHGLAHLGKKFPGYALATLTHIHEYVEKRFIRHVDAIDNGAWPENMGFIYSSLVSDLNPIAMVEDFAPEQNFGEAIDFAARTLDRWCLKGLADLNIEERWTRAARVCSGRAVLLEEYMPWFDISTTSVDSILYVIYPSQTGEWMVQQVPDKIGSPKGRKALPEKWAGLRDGEFQGMTGIKDGIFCHAARFICGAVTQEGAIALADLAADE